MDGVLVGRGEERDSCGHNEQRHTGLHLDHAPQEKFYWCPVAPTSFTSRN
jgi:hypothetical protein